MEKFEKSQIEEQKQKTAARIRREREILGLTQDRMAEKLGLSADNYKKIEEGINGMSMQSLRSIRSALDVSYDYLLDGKQDTLEQIARQVNALSRAEQMALLIRIVSNLSRTKFDETMIQHCMDEDPLSLPERKNEEK